MINLGSMQGFYCVDVSYRWKNINEILDLYGSIFLTNFSLKYCTDGTQINIPVLSGWAKGSMIRP